MNLYIPSNVYHDIPKTLNDRDLTVWGYPISEMEYFALEAIKRDAADVWAEALKQGFEIKKNKASDELKAKFDREQEALRNKMDAERDAMLEKLTNPAK